MLDIWDKPRRNLDKVCAVAGVLLLVVALLVCGLDSEGTAKDSAARVAGLLGTFLSVVSLLLRVWESSDRVVCIPTKFDHSDGQGHWYFAVEVYNAGSVPVQVQEVEVWHGVNFDKLKRVKGDAVIRPKESAIYSDTTDRKQVVKLNQCGAIVWKLDGKLAELKGEGVYNALIGLALLDKLKRRGRM